MQKTYKILISGQVQGVGFRPHVYNLASKYLLKGTVSNNESGVIIYITGTEKKANNFFESLLNNFPPASKIRESSISSVPYKHFEDFQIIPSAKGGALNLSLTPDFAICEQCKSEIIDPENRRYNYPFTTCVNCGPRWAITDTFPFERDHTSIAAFTMCEACKAEYTTFSDRRFHSQTNSCKTCGISTYLTDNKNNIIESDPGLIFGKIAQLLTDGAIVAIKNTSGYLLCCNAENREVVEQLRKRKSRPQKPFAVLYPSIEKLHSEIGLNRNQTDLLSSRERPITILPLANYQGKIALDQVAPELNQLGVMLPYSGILQLLANELSFPIVATSGNIHRSPIISRREEAVEKLNQVADYFLQHNLRIMHPQDDSVLKFSKKFDIPVFFRRSRGYAPNYLVEFPNSDQILMAMGSQLKSTIAYYPNNYLYISEYLGDLENYNVYERFTQTVHSFISIFEKRPEVILVDKHPGYNSTRYGRELAEIHNSKVFEIQHHKAHLAAILAEHQLFDSTVLGVIFDGTGYGDDGQVWGGEFFSYNTNTIERIGHFQYFDWILGDKMSMEPRLSLLSLADPSMVQFMTGKFNTSELKTYDSVLKNNKLKTSSVGRLFDAVASLIGISDYNTYEGEAAILLENFIDTYDPSACRNYHETIENEISARLIIKEMYKDLVAGVSQKQLVANFLFTLTSIILKMAERHGSENVVLSGGVFQNTTLVDMLIELAPKEIKLYFHKNLSPNDENIAFGQIAYYLNINDQQ